MSKPIISVEHLSKYYEISHQKRGVDTFVESATAFGKGLIERIRHPFSPNRVHVDLEEFHALDDVSFEIEQGDRVGIIGRNGAGKSTLLKLLSRITEPTRGRIIMRGRVASLLEVGTGFHPELSGRENIYLNGAILGMKRTEVKAKFDEIVDFSGVEKFLDTPVKRYSSGMYVRLAFAVAAHLEPEILLIDEVLAVGDSEFQKKCVGKMGDIAEKEGRTILFISHNMGLIKQLCNKGILLDQGQKIMEAEASPVIDCYELLRRNNQGFIPVGQRKDRSGNGEVRITNIELNEPDIDQNIQMTIRYESNSPLTHPRLAVSINKYCQTIIFMDSNLIDHFPTELPCRGTIHIALPDDFFLPPGFYDINIAFFIEGALGDYIQNAYSFETKTCPGYGQRMPLAEGFCFPKQKWTFEL